MSKKPSRHVAHHETCDSGDAFVPDVSRGHGSLSDEAEDFAEEFIATATSGEDAFEAARDEFLSEELGGPFLELETKEVIRAARTAGMTDEFEEA